MTPTQILLIVLSVVVFLIIAWYAVSYFFRHRRLANESKIYAFTSWAHESLGIHVDMLRLEQNWLAVNDVPLHIDVLPYRQGAPTVLFIPGTAAYAQIYVQFMFALNERGFNVVGYDPRGHGRSGGPRGDFVFTELYRDAIEVGRYAKRRFGGKLAVCGTSQGGITGLYAISGAPDVFDAGALNNIADLNGRDNLVLSKFAPPLWALNFFIWLFSKPMGRLVMPLSLYLDFQSQKLNNGMDAATFLSRDPRAVVLYTFRVLASLARTLLPTPIEKMTEVPILLFQGEEDNVFPLPYTEKMYDLLRCPKRLLIFPGLPHLILTNNVPQVIGPISDWLHEVLDV